MLSTLRATLDRFTADRHASLLVEFALGLPLLLAIYAGTTELERATSEWRKLTLLSRTMADLTAQGDAQNPISTTVMNDIVSAGGKIMRPYDTGSLKVVVSAMGVDLSVSNVNPRVCSSFAAGGATARTVGTATALTIPDGYRTTGMRYVLAEVSINYTPALGSSFVKLVKGARDAITFTSNTYWPARGGQKYGSNQYYEVILPGSGSKACDNSAP